MFFCLFLRDGILINCLYVLLRKNLIFINISIIVMILVIVKIMLFILILMKLLRLILGIIIVFIE